MIYSVGFPFFSRMVLADEPEYADGMYLWF